MGVRDNHTKFEPETQRWRPGTGVASGGPQFQKLQFRAKNSHFYGQNSPRTHSKRPSSKQAARAKWAKIRTPSWCFGFR